MKSTVVHEFKDEDGSAHRERLLANIMQGPRQLVELDDLLELNARGGVLAVIRDGHLGDCVMMTAVLAELHKLLPNVRVYVYTDPSFQRVFKYNETVAHVAAIGEFLNEDYAKVDMDVDLRRFVERSPESKSLNRVHLFARAFGVTMEDPRTTYTVTEQDTADTETWLATVNRWSDKQDAAPASVGLLIAPHASDPRRHLPESLVAKLHEWAEARYSECSNPSLIVGPTCFHKPTLPVLGGLCMRATAAVTADNGVYHLAEAIGGTRCVAVFTTISPGLRVATYENVRPVLPRCECSPCDEVPREGCAVECKDTIEAADIFAVLDEWVDA